MTKPCNSCGAQIEFVTTESGRKMPLDATGYSVVPDDTAKTTYFRLDGSTFKARPFSIRDNVDTVIGYVSHFASCPHAKRHRKAR